VAIDVGTGTTASLQIGLATGDLTNKYTGDGASTVILWGAQVENAGQPYPTTYIPTTSAGVQRNSENFTYPASTIPNVASPGSVFLIGTYSQPFVNATNQRWFDTTSAVNTNGMSLFPTSNINLQLRIDPIGIMVNFAQTLARNLASSYLCTYRWGRMALYINGRSAALANNVGITLPAAKGVLNVGQSSQPGGQVDSWIRRLMVFDCYLDHMDAARIKG
jgi:hypothetical protein